MRQFLLFPVLLLFAVSVSVPAFSQSSAKHFTKTRVVELNYLLYLPPAYATDTHSTFPLILFLHGSGESGSDLNQVKNNGIPKLIAEGKDFPFVVVSPQNPSSDVSWDTKSLKMLLDEVISTYRIDTNRLYLTGLSMGGWGTWDMQFRYQDLFAAIAPVCGFFDYILEDDYKPVPVWIFHGAKDDVVPVNRAVEMFQAVRKHGGEVKITIYPEANHNAWTETYNNPELYTWFLKHSKNSKTESK